MSTAPDPARARLRGRLVTYGILGAMVLAVAFHVEAWPMTSFRLFSFVRTSTQSELVLYAVDGAGARTEVPIDRDQRSVLNTERQLADVKGASPSRQQAMLDAWFDDAGLDPSRYAAALIQRITTRTQRDGSPPVEVARTDVVEVPLR